ncbi:tail-specific protease [Bacteroidota bacterium]|nr:tail-specific protease [Bacteroidota bacterium]
MLLVLSVFASYKLTRKPSGLTKEQLIMEVVMQGVQSQHFNPLKVDDKFSTRVFDLFLKRMDNSKKFFLQSDVDELSKYKEKIDDQINDASLEFFDKANAIYEKRFAQAKTYYASILEQPFKFKEDETIETDGDKIPYAKNEVELKDAWRKSLKYQTLVRLNDMLEAREKAKEKEDTSAIAKKTDDDLENDARKKVLKSTDDAFKNLSELDRTDRFNLYVGCFANAQDPHTEFFPPADKANFDIAMSGKLEGIGAQLQQKDDEIKVSSIVPGSPSYRDGRLKPGDIIVKVAQGSAEPVDVSEMRLDKAIQLIRGKKGTEVRLTVKKPDATFEVITLIRDIIVLEDTYAQSYIINNEKKIGYIRLPGFYADFSGAGGRDCAKDIKSELEKLKTEGAKGVILDLRDNGGGSLESVVDMVGLLIPQGPVVQVKARDANPTLYTDKDPSVTYDGPFEVMINENSASASEILAAAIQDYNRGVIIGSATSFGKGTVQRMYNMDDMVNATYSSMKPLGSVKITMQKFYRVSGASTQLRGVTPDIILPDAWNKIKYGEKQEDFPMPWDEIKPTPITKFQPSYDLNKLKATSQKRVEDQKAFSLIEEESVELKSESDNTQVSLNLEKYQLEQKTRKEENKKFDEVQKTLTGLDISNLITDIQHINSDSTYTARNKEMLKSLKKDIYLNEAAQVMMDMIK